MMTARLAAAAAIVTVLMGAAAMALYWNTGFVQYLWNNVLPPSFWTLTGLGVAHWRQMDGHRVTQVAMISGHVMASRAHAEARMARKIMADLYKHQTGVHHPAAPREGM